MKPVTTKRMRLSAEDLLLAALEGGSITYSHVKTDPESPKTINTVIEFEETPDELKEAIATNGAINNRIGKIKGWNEKIHPLPPELALRKLIMEG